MLDLNYGQFELHIHDLMLMILFGNINFLGSQDDMDVIFGFSSFFDRFRHIICQIQI